MTDHIPLYVLKCVRPKPNAIRCLCYNKKCSRLAVSRSDHSIEVWDLTAAPYLEKVIVSNSNFTVEAVAWLKNRLYSAGAEGTVLEHDLQTLTVKEETDVMKNVAIWCMKTSNDGKKLAVGNNNGHVTLLERRHGELTMTRSFQKQDGAVLCLDWHKNDEILITGTLDMILMWDVCSGQVTKSIYLARASRKQSTVVWCLAILEDMTVVSGDSCGKLSFWDGNTGTLLSQSSTTKDSKTDILTIAVSEDEQRIYSSGVDPITTLFQKSQSNGKWMRSIERSMHTHDVRCLEMVDDCLFSGGDDCRLVMCKSFPNNRTNFSPLCQRFRNSTVFAKDVNYFLAAYPDCLGVLKLDMQNPTENTCFIKIKSRKNATILCSTLSSDGKWLAYSTQKSFSLFRTNLENPSLYEKVKISKSVEISFPVTKMVFTSSPTKLIIYSQSKISILKCEVEEPLIEAVLTDDTESFCSLDIMVLSPDNLFLGCGSTYGGVIVYNLKTLKVHCGLPLYEYRPTALQFDATSENLVVAYSDRKVVEYSLKDLCYTKWSKSLDASNVSLQLQNDSNYPITSVIIHPSSLHLQDESCIYSFSKQVGCESFKKRHKSSSNSGVPVGKGIHYKKQKFREITTLLQGENSVIMVAIPPGLVTNSLPPPIWKKRFGT